MLYCYLYIPLLLVYNNRNCFVLDNFNTELFVYGICGKEGYVQFGMFEQIIYSMYKWTVESGGVQCGGVQCGGVQCGVVQCGVSQ